MLRIEKANKEKDKMVKTFYVQKEDSTNRQVNVLDEALENKAKILYMTEDFNISNENDGVKDMENYLNIWQVIESFKTNKYIFSFEG